MHLRDEARGQERDDVNVRLVGKGALGRAMMKGQMAEGLLRNLGKRADVDDGLVRLMIT